MDGNGRWAKQKGLIRALGHESGTKSVKSTVETCAKLVKTLKDATQGRLKIARGGAVLETGEYSGAGTGADVVTNDIEAALTGLGLVDQPATIMERA